MTHPTAVQERSGARTVHGEAPRTDVEAAVTAAVDGALARGEAGLGVAVYHDGALVADVIGGVADEATGRPVVADTLFWLGSVTKLFSALALHLQAERGLVDYAAPIVAYWPEFGAHGKDRATVLDALSHRTGLPVFPTDATVETMCDWAWVTDRLARMHPLHEPGTRNAYHAFTFGFIIGEIVRRTDPAGRSFREFVHEELFAPLGADEVWMGIPAEVDARVANVRNAPPSAASTGFDQLIQPAAVHPVQANYGRPEVRQACLPSAGAIGNARSVARVLAMVAGGGELDGVRLLSENRVRLFAAPRPIGWDLVMGDRARLGVGGFWLADPTDPSTSVMGTGLGVIGHPGAGGNLAWCDLDRSLAVAITANRPDGRETPESNPLGEIGRAVRAALDARR